jgi:hypothetical protein
MAQEGFIDHWTAMAEKTDNSQANFAQSVVNARKIVFHVILIQFLWSSRVRP